MLKQLGSPAQSYPTVHVAGTNGKGSVCAYVMSVLIAAGFRTGRFVSPHLVEPRDAVTINGDAVSKAEWAETAAIVRDASGAARQTLTQFEFWTAQAFLCFARANVDVAVIEVGMGGRLDATNSGHCPRVSIITSISLDHQHVLGATLPEIGRQKAGIIKPESYAVVVSPNQDAAVLAVIIEQARQTRTPVHVVEPARWIDRAARTSMMKDGFGFDVALNGDFQLENAATALEALRQLRLTPGFERISDQTIRDGLSRTTWHGRLEWLELPQLGHVLLDGGHNVAAMHQLREYVDSVLGAPTSLWSPGARIWVFACSASKDLIGNLRELLRDGDILLAVPYSPPEGMAWVHCFAPEDIARVVRDALPNVHATACASLSDALGLCEEKRRFDPNVFVGCCGSLYLVSDVYRLLVHQ